MSKRKVFDRVQAMEQQDLQVFKRKKSDRQRSLAAQSQNKVFQRLVECRILLQRALDKPATEENAVNQCDKVIHRLISARNSLRTHTDNGGDSEQISSSLTTTESINGLLEEEYGVHRETWKEVLDRRHKDVRLHAGTAQKFPGCWTPLSLNRWSRLCSTKKSRMQQLTVLLRTRKFTNKC